MITLQEKKTSQHDVKLFRQEQLMNIPNEVNIAGISIRVEFATELPEGCIGKADYQNQKIVINKDFAGRHLTEQTFYHELVH